MKKRLQRAIMIAFIALLFDQVIKYVMVLQEVYIEGLPISLVLAYNKGVAFSMLSGLDETLKYLQIVLMCGIGAYLYKNQDLFYVHYIPIGLLFGAAFSNILDRFTYGAVVDYIFWHYLFEFAIFNAADVMINIAVALIVWQSFKKSKET